MIIATGRTDILPELEQLHRIFSFEHRILPHSTSAVYKSAQLEYIYMAKALKIYIHKPDTIQQASCSVLLEYRKIHHYEKDGFVLLLHILASIFPRLGGPQLDVVAEIASIKLSQGETYDSL